jgi:hypothetical protein
VRVMSPIVSMRFFRARRADEVQCLGDAPLK